MQTASVAAGIFPSLQYADTPQAPLTAPFQLSVHTVEDMTEAASVLVAGTARAPNRRDIISRERQLFMLSFQQVDGAYVSR